MKALFLSQKIASNISNMGMAQFNQYMDKMKKFNDLIVNGPEFQLLGVINGSTVQGPEEVIEPTVQLYQGL